ncbi:GatB/YqeY domain-containing protein [Sulfobacillus thermosulfidooxidans]|uniref:GatB/YqeY domain-containing protein n=1 Tax=Sulfobacillus thermosulfidooxidans TaxID=28034 RepID=UPI00096BA033|nr:GatB/YqeY domain-containing protein [Sulfobacillus thermosulfidooxidans]OLZ10466.1 aspartyl-tRNA amidotransferase [Sulfobacillus thermosulfidooxidans]OLZ14278.1 aspartyl-tRNA amidotransferase [Sulfobacillus thermosulfidooxidans]OLZ19021.1 aspartyl-tRNA amidotransferase [Sulfobacillus thermosulfidooxidans]
MSLREQLNEDLKSAMRAKDQARLSVIRSIKAGILAQETRSERTTLDDEGILQVIVKEIKERKDANSEFEKAGRQDLVEKNLKEIEILSLYLPEPLSEDELAQLIDAAITACGATSPKDMGKVMAIVNPQIRGRADGRHVADLVKARLSR